MDSGAEHDSLAKRTVQRIQSALEKGQIVGMPEVVRLIQELSTKAFSITTNGLAEIIEQDVAVTAKVIASANTMGYNPSGMPVNTVSQSIQIIGFERVRNLAMSMLLAENASQPFTAPEQREVASFALSSGLFAQSLMEDRDGDPEHAFVCASLCSYGRLLITTFMIDEYRRAIDLALDKGEDAAFREVFGLTPLELSFTLLQNAHLPRNILRTIQKLPTSLINASVLRPDDEMIVLSDFSVRVCELAMDVSLDAGRFKTQAGELSRLYGASFMMDEAKIQGAFAKALTRYTEFGQTYGLHRSSNNTMRVIAARSTDTSPPEDIDFMSFVPRDSEGADMRARRKSAPPDEPEVETKAPGPAVSRIDSDRLMASIRKLLELIGLQPLDLAAVYEEILDSLVKGLSLDNAMLLRCDKKQRFKMLVSHGASVSGLRRGMESISSVDHDVFGICLSREEDVLIENVSDDNASRYLPMWLKLNAPILSLILLPVIDDGALKGLFCGLRSKGGPLRLSPDVLQDLRAIRIHLATVWRMDASRPTGMKS